METILQHTQGLVYSLLCLMPSVCQKASLKALLGLFLDAQGHALPAHTWVKSASSLSRFLNHYTWSTLSVIRTTRQAILQHIASLLPHGKIPIRILIDLTTLEGVLKVLSQVATDTIPLFLYAQRALIPLNPLGDDRKRGTLSLFPPFSRGLGGISEC